MHVQEKQPCKVLIESYLYSGCLVQGTVRLRSTCGGHCGCERSVCTLSGTSIAVMSHCDSGIHHECQSRIPPHGVRREPITTLGFVFVTTVLPSKWTGVSLKGYRQNWQERAPGVEKVNQLRKTKR
jgi:hypothetical protein